MAGTTAVVVLLKNNRLYCGNVGDSRAIISVNGLAEPLSYDHKPANESEARRIIAAGGWVEFNRVNGNLALSRALGDFVFKRNEDMPAEEQIVTANPDIITRDLTSDVEFMVLACDGIWDVMSNQEVIDYCRDRLAVGMETEMVCEELLTRCLAPDSQMGGLGCDNMTVVLVCLLQNGTWAQFCEKCSHQRAPSPYPLDDDDELMSDHQHSPSNAAAQPYVTPPHTPSGIVGDAPVDLAVGAAVAADNIPTLPMATKNGNEADEHPPQIFNADDGNTAPSATDAHRHGASESTQQVSDTPATTTT